MAEIDRNPRTKTTREAEKRYVWKPASILPEPNPRPGIGHRWIATAVLGESQHTNVSKNDAKAGNLYAPRTIPSWKFPVMLKATLRSVA